MYFSKFLIIFLVTVLPAKIFAQDITGLWKGTLYNDSTQKYYRYEIGISEEKGKLSGFSHTFFLAGDKEFYGVKKVKIRKVDGKIIVEDAGLLANNYPETPAKGVRQLNILTLEIKDSIMTLTGPYTTNRTKKFAPITGTVTLQRKNDFWQSALVPHLQELGLSNDLSFVKKEDDLQKEIMAKTNADKSVASNNNNAIKDAAAKTETKPNAGKDISSKNAAPSKPVSIKETTENKAAANPSETKASVSKENAAKEIKTLTAVPPAAEVNNRKTVLQQTVYYNSDSLQISLYDNGEVDGDTVSVLMNGKIIMAKEGLSTKAVQKTIYADPANDNIELIMYAENLGAIAPNTGLLVVHDGKSIYEIRFSGDLQKNASIMLQRRKN